MDKNNKQSKKSKIPRIIYSVFFIFSIIIVALSIYIYRVSTEQMGLRGAGTIVNPYKISSSSDLVYLGKLVDSGYTFEKEYIEQTVDIDMESIGLFNPIGNEDYSFQGIYDGGGHSINNIVIEEEEGALFLGLGGQIKNLVVASGKISGNYAAGFAVKAVSSQAIISNCYNYATIHGEIRSSGIADDFSKGKINFCYNFGEIQGEIVNDISAFNVGELISINMSGDEIIMPETFTGYSYFISGTSDYLVDVINSFFSLGTTNFNKFSEINFLQDSKIFFTGNTLKRDIIRGINGKGTYHIPYLIQDVDDFLLFTDLVNSGIDFKGVYFKQKNNIDLVGIDEINPIGIFDSAKYFWGVYNGNSYSISNLNMDREDNCGLFGVLAGTVLNVSLENCHINGNCVGGIASHSYYLSRPQIINCICSGSNITGVTRAGGIADNFGNGDIILCVVDNSTSVNAPKESFICACDAKYIINCYAYDCFSNKPIIEKNVLCAESVTGKIISDLVIDGSLVKTLNKYINQHSSVRYVRSTDLNLWETSSTLKLSDQHSSRIIYKIVDLLLITGLFILVLIFNKNKIGILKNKIIISISEARRHRIIFVSIALSLLVLFVIYNLIENGIGFDRLYYNYSNGDAFTDRLSMIYFASDMASDRYILSESFYPPLNNLLYWLLSFYCGGYIENRFSYFQSHILNDNQIATIIFLAIALEVSIVFVLLRKYIVGNSISKSLIAIISFLSAPMLYAIERGNSLVLSFLLVMCFLIYYKNSDSAKRECALLSLAFSICLKIYPVFFCILLIDLNKKKNSINKILRVFIYSIVITTLSTIPYGGWSAVKGIFSNVVGLQRGTLDFSTATRLNYFRGLSVNFYNLFRLFFNENCAQKFSWILYAYVFLIAILVIVFVKEEYKKTIVAACLLCGVPNLSSFYTLIFFIPSFLQIYNKDDLEKIDYIYNGIIICMISFTPIYYFNNDFSLYSIVSPIGALLLISLLFFDSVFKIKSVECTSSE
ncbi:hypothetical protein [Pseudobutyrivibrio xylanivorans]|nr:hypothetical protein [Pseudobutyrivibrio xylanivorans]